MSEYVSHPDPATKILFEVIAERRTSTGRRVPSDVLTGARLRPLPVVGRSGFEICKKSLNKPCIIACWMCVEKSRRTMTSSNALNEKCEKVIHLKIENF
jgi:hypothetical protein